MTPGAGWGYSENTTELSQQQIQQLFDGAGAALPGFARDAAFEAVQIRARPATRENVEAAVEEVNRVVEQISMAASSASAEGVRVPAYLEGVKASLIEAKKGPAEHQQMMMGAAAALSGLFGGKPPEEAKACGACMLEAGVELDPNNPSPNMTEAQELGHGLTAGLTRGGRSMGMTA